MKITVKEFLDDVMNGYQQDDIVLKFEIIIKRSRSTSVRCNPNFPKYEEQDAPQEIVEAQDSTTNSQSVSASQICPICKGSGWVPYKVSLYDSVRKYDHDIKQWCVTCKGSGKLHT